MIFSFGFNVIGDANPVGEIASFEFREVLCSIFSSIDYSSFIRYYYRNLLEIFLDNESGFLNENF